MKYLTILQQGGPVFVLIGICALVAAFVFVRKWFEFYRAQVNINEIVTGLINVLRRDGMIEAITLCDNSPGPVPRVLSSAIRAYKEGDDIRDALADDDRLHEHDMRLMAQAAGKPTEVLAVSYFEQVPSGVAEKLGLKIRRIRLKDKKPIALIEPSEYLERLRT